jgi:hypothetical protein
VTGNDDKLHRVKRLVQDQEIDTARSLLESMPNDPRAQKWLRQLNQRYPPPQQERLWESDAHDKRLAQAQQLLREQRYREARWLLVEIRHIPQAQQWLVELDELEGRNKSAQKEEAVQQKIAATPDNLQALGDFVRSGTFRIGVGSVMMLGSIVVLVMWLTVPWVEGAGPFVPLPVFGNVTETCTAAELNAGRLKCQQLGYVQPEVFFRGNTGFVSVRIVDRGLTVIPFLASVAIVFGWSYSARRTDTFTAMSVLTFCAVMFAAVPFMWESLSQSEAENLWTNVRVEGSTLSGLNQPFANYLERTYATFPFKAVGVSIAVFMVVAAGLTVAEISGWLGVRRPSSLQDPDAHEAEFAAGVFERARRSRKR